jgi:hypothetical protein
MLTLNYVHHNSGILRKYCIEIHGVFLDSKLYSHQNVNNLFCLLIKLLGQIRTITFSFSSTDSFCCLVRTKVE